MPGQYLLNQVEAWCPGLSERYWVILEGDRDPDPFLSTSTAEGAGSGGPFLCGALETSVVLLQWYQPMNKFLLVRVSL